MTIHYQDDRVTLHHGDCLAVLRALPDCSVDSVVTDPPYALSFMGREWDTHDTPEGFQAWCNLWATECLRVLKPGGHMLAFGGTRTWHRLACAIEDAGFEVRDSLAWAYGSGFPKSLDVSKAIDKQRDDRADILAVTAEIRRLRDAAGLANSDLDAMFGFAGMAGHWTSTASQPAVPKVDQWAQLRLVIGSTPELDAEVWRLNGRKGTPGEAWDRREVVGEASSGIHSAFEYAKSGESGKSATFAITAPATPDAERWQGWGTALKPAYEPIVLARKPLIGTVAQNVLAHGTGALNVDGCRIGAGGGTYKASKPSGESRGIYGTGINGTVEIGSLNAGRWPANLILDEHQAAALDEQSGEQRDGVAGARTGLKNGFEGGWGAQPEHSHGYGSGGGASRFFYVAKADSSERPRVNGVAHPTVKPLSLMQWLVRLVTPPGGTVLEPFAGSGTTVEACIREGFRCIAIERETDYLPLIEARIARRVNPVRAVEIAGEDGGLFDLIDGEAS